MKDFNLLKSIKKEISLGNVSAREFDGLTIYKYTDECMYGKHWNSINRQCRGLILDNDSNIYARGFSKFFNLGEMPESSLEYLPLDQPYEIWDKIDGSNGLLYHHPRHGWRIATPGSMDSEQAEEGTRILHAKYSGMLKSIPQETTLLFEIIGETTKQVVDYGNRKDLILLAMINFAGGEWHSSRVDRFANENGLERPTLYHKVDLANPYFKSGMEGYVLKWDNGFRIKLKSPEYTQIHKILYYLTPKNVIDLLQGKEYRDTIKILPKELQIKFDDIRAQVQAKYDAVALEVDRLYMQLIGLNLPNRKEQALWINANAIEYAPILFGLLSNKSVQHIIWKLIHEKLL